MWHVEGSLGGGESELENAAASMRCVVERNRELFSGEWIIQSGEEVELLRDETFIPVCLCFLVIMFSEEEGFIYTHTHTHTHLIETKCVFCF